MHLNAHFFSSRKPGPRLCFRGSFAVPRAEDAHPVDQEGQFGRRLILRCCVPHFLTPNIRDLTKGTISGVDHFSVSRVSFSYVLGNIIPVFFLTTAPFKKFNLCAESTDVWGGIWDITVGCSFLSFLCPPGIPVRHHLYRFLS